MTIDSQTLRALADYKKEGEHVAAMIAELSQDLPSFVKFFARYTSWNGVFGASVASLAAKIGRSRSLFVEEGFPSHIADRSVLVASYFFDAARDEFDDRDTKHRDTHRCLAQAALAGLIESVAGTSNAALSDPEKVALLCADPSWLVHLRQRVATGYGHGWPDERSAIFRAIGYHLGSELLADREFSVMDSELRRLQPKLIEKWSNLEVTIAGQSHRAYQWIRIHSGHGGGAEADHFAWAVRGVELALRYTPQTEVKAQEEWIAEGYLDFVRDHREFFARVRS